MNAGLKTLSLRRDFKAPSERLDEVKATLAASDAVRERVVEQVDYVYDVPRPSGAHELAKLRHERPNGWNLYLYNPAESGPDVSFRLVEGLDRSVKEILDLLLGTPLEIAKLRQIWHDGGVTIHVDDVGGRGGIVDIESWPQTDGSMIDRYRRLLAWIHRFVLRGSSGMPLKMTS